MERDHLSRWKNALPDSDLTWGEVLNGDNFVILAQKYQIFSPKKAILELGPGYGRILRSILNLKIPFSAYTGVDISQKNMEYLKQTFRDSRLQFVYGGFDDVKLQRKYDVVISSAVLKHQFPSFENALKNILRFVNKEGILFFDLIENKENIITDANSAKGPQFQHWETDPDTYIAHYTQNEVKNILHNLELESVAFDHVTHLEKLGDRLVVIARSP